jgi:NADH-quinone oxidoreductase subunit G
VSDTAPTEGVVISGTAEAEPPGVAVTVDGKEIFAKEGELVIDAAERHGVYIPRFCYHPRMKPVGMCRMCIVEIDTGRGPTLQPACMLECTEGMSVDTESDVTKKAQDGVLEFLLINHPLDCPVCDKGGECPLQDQTMAYGPGESRFVEEKRHFEKPIPISDLVLLDRERCILCDRCTRFASDVAGDPLISFLQRGSRTEVNTYPDEPFSSYFSGNTVQICPVGALLGSPYRFRARPWDLESTESTCQTCSVGCRMAIDSSRNELLRYSGVDIDPVNWGWLCDKGRFNFQANNNPDRLTEPLVRDGDAYRPARWNDALRAVADAVRAGMDRSGPAGVALLGGARLNNEGAYAWSRLVKGFLGTDNTDAQLGDGLPADLVLGLPKATIDEVCRPGGTVLLLCPDLKEELPVLFLRHAVMWDGATVIDLGQQLNSNSSLATIALQARPGCQAQVIAALLSDDQLSKEVGGVPVDVLRDTRAMLQEADGPITVVLGRQSVAESPRGVVDAASVLLERLDGVQFLMALRRGNVHGALDMGLTPGFLPGRVALEAGREWFGEQWPAVPAEPGLDALGILQAAAEGRIDTLFLVGADPLSDFPDRDLVGRALANARTVVAVDQFLTESSRRADVVLPVAGFAEVGGTTTNLEGRVTALSQRVTPPGTAQPDWVIATELAFQLGHDLGWHTLDQVTAEIARTAPSHAGVTPSLLGTRAGTDGVVVPLQAGTGEESTEESAEEATDEATDETVEVTEVTPPALVVFEPAGPADPPALDSYSLRLIASRKLYDEGVSTQHSPSLSKLAPGTVLRINPYDFDRMGIEPGDRMQITSSRGSVGADVHIDGGVPRGCAAVFFNQPGVQVGQLIDAAERVTDVRIERES